MKTTVYIAKSLDGYIARENGDIDWLDNIDNPGDDDFGYGEFIKGIDAIVIGRNTFEKVLTFKKWPYTKPVFVLSTTIKSIPEFLNGKAQLLSMKPREILDYLSENNYSNLYVDGGITIQKFLDENLIDELIITEIPVLIGSGIPLFGNLRKDLWLKHKWTKTYPNGLVESCYVR